jgi:predicted aconitase with swiveling domain
MEIAATCILPGTNRGRLLSTHQPISFWGCVDPATGNISDRRHELFGESISEKVLAFPFGKGSSTGSLMILELLRLNLAPAAIINIRTEPLLATGPVVGKHFYGNMPKLYPKKRVHMSASDATLFNNTKAGHFSAAHH